MYLLWASFRLHPPQKPDWLLLFLTPNWPSVWTGAVKLVTKDSLHFPEIHPFWFWLSTPAYGLIGCMHCFLIGVSYLVPWVIIPLIPILLFCLLYHPPWKQIKGRHFFVCFYCSASFAGLIGLFWCEAFRRQMNWKDKRHLEHWAFEITSAHVV